MNEIIYILINEAMPGYVKIGRTTDLEQRIRTLDNTSMPLPFECYYACTVKDSQFVEKQLHDSFLDHRVRSSRERYSERITRVNNPETAQEMAEVENVTPKKDFVETPEDQQALDEARTRRAVFNFKMVDIPMGSELSFVRDENVKARVLDNRYLVQGPAFWMFEGEILDERRSRIENEQ